MSDRENSPPRTIRTKALHGSIRDISGASVAQALAGNGGSILGESQSEIKSVAKTLHEKLSLEYNMRADQLREKFRDLHPEEWDDAGVMEDEFGYVIKDLLKDTEVACEKVRSMRGFDFSLFTSYCNLAGIYQLSRVLAELMKPPVTFEIPNIQKIYMDYLSRGEVFKLDRASLLKISRKVARAVIEPDKSDYDSDAPRPARGTRAYLASMAARKTSAPFAVRSEKNIAKKKARIDPPVPKPASPPKIPTAVANRSVSPIRQPVPPSTAVDRSLSPVSDSSSSSVRKSPRLNDPGKAVAKLPSLLEGVMETMKTTAAKKAPAVPPESPKHITQRFADFANLIAYIHEPFDPSIPTAITEAKDLKQLLSTELESIENKQRNGEFFTQQ
jgi:hypothetical protein